MSSNTGSNPGSQTSEVTIDVIPDPDAPPAYVGKTLLNKEQVIIINEILKCSVCLEIPKGKPILQVKSCEKGHHFCMTCHTKLKTCAICRGRFFMGRNFVVEELITKLGPDLGLSRPLLPPPKPSLPIGKGRYPCPHNCGLDIPAVSMLPHIRKLHKECLLDNMRINPFTLRMDVQFSVVYKPDSTSGMSVQISDVGLLTTRVRFIGSDLRAWVQTMIREDVSPDMKYKITITHSDSEYSLNNLPVLGYFASSDQPALSVVAKQLPPVGTQLQFFVSMWRKEDEVEEEFDPDRILLPEDPVQFASDRRTRRNRHRNKRKTKLRAKLRTQKISVPKLTQADFDAVESFRTCTPQ